MALSAHVPGSVSGDSVGHKGGSAVAGIDGTAVGRAPGKKRGLDEGCVAGCAAACVPCYAPGYVPPAVPRLCEVHCRRPRDMNHSRFSEMVSCPKALDKAMPGPADAVRVRSYQDSLQFPFLSYVDYTSKLDLRQPARICLAY
jgi:hypothetical protein